MHTYRKEFINAFISYTAWLLGIELLEAEQHQFPTATFNTPKQIRKLRVDAGKSLIDIVNSMAPENVGYTVPDRVWRAMTDVLVSLPAFQLYPVLTYSESAPDYYYAADHELIAKTFGQGCSPRQVGTRWDPLALGVDAFRSNATNYLMALLSQALQAYGVNYHPGLITGDFILADWSDD